MDVVATFAFVVSMMALGRVMAWRGLLSEDAPQALNMVVLYVCLPAAILRHAPTLEFDPALFGLLAIPWTLLVVMSAVVLGLARVLGWGRSEVAVMLLLTVLGNTSFLGFAVVPALAGEAALRYALVYDQFGSFIQLSTFGLVVVAIYSGSQRPSPLTIAKRLLAFPPLWVLVFALFLPAEHPPLVEGLLLRLEGALLPLVALAIGVQAKLSLDQSDRRLLAIGLALKLVIGPALALGLAIGLGLSGEMLAAGVYESAMPPMITAGALASLAGLRPGLAAALVGWGMLVAMISLPSWWWVLGRLGLGA